MYCVLVTMTCNKCHVQVKGDEEAFDLLDPKLAKTDMHSGHTVLLYTNMLLRNYDSSICSVE